jgi:hypothetical protein
MMAHKVVAHLLDGPLIKGSSYGVASDRPVCHVRTPDAQVIGPADPPIPYDGA